MILLKKIIDNKRIEIEERKKTHPEFADSEIRGEPLRNFHNALIGNGITIIAELKSRSPSAGTIKENLDPAALALVFESAGAGAISVLTDEKFFGGKDRFLKIVKNTVSLPVLRKDFIIDPYQINESKYMGADAILLITRILNPNTLKNFIRSAEKIGIDCLVEVHSRGEIKTALKSGATMIGINNRDLDTFDIDLNKSLELKKYIPAGITTISASGLKNRVDIELMSNAGFDAVLIGASLMTADNITEYVKELTGRGSE